MSLRKYPFFGVFLKLILTTFLFSVVGCGSKKKTTEINKSVYKEEKDLSVFRQKNSLTNVAKTEYFDATIYEPMNPKEKMVVDGKEYQNVKITKQKKKIDSTAQVTAHDTEQVGDKGKVYSSNETKNTDLDREGSSDGWVKIVWGFVFLAAILAIGKWKKWF